MAQQVTFRHTYTVIVEEDGGTVDDTATVDQVEQRAAQSGDANVILVQRGNAEPTAVESTCRTETVMTFTNPDAP